uniref:Uncharacterized protein n=1 Tax=Fibrocapsa japonica TaxID=94617 RepID=A0A7S2XXB0_9STRA|mmetsp:Transcript_18045/g.26271  ORF Transcript_18045/g.26271 Transcript_18045/m.26271 type:complete len:125 (+) Transcript_18045:135-509(+)
MERWVLYDSDMKEMEEESLASTSPTNRADHNMEIRESFTGTFSERRNEDEQASTSSGSVASGGSAVHISGGQVLVPAPMAPPTGPQTLPPPPGGAVAEAGAALDPLARRLGLREDQRVETRTNG